MPIRHPRRLDMHHAFPQPPQTPTLYRNIALSFLGVTIVVIGVVVWMSSVHATVSVKVKRDMAKIDTVVEIAKSPEQGQLQGRVVEGTFDNIQEFKVKGESVTSIVTATTTGKVRITNNYSKAQPLIKTTRLLTPDGRLFHISSSVTVAPGKTVEVMAYSDKPGVAYAAKSGTKFIIPGLWIDLQKLIYAEALTDFVGTASTNNKKTVADSDITGAQKSLQDAVVEQAKKTLATEAGVPVDKLADDCPADQGCWQAVYLVTPVEMKSNVTAGSQTDTFLAQVKVKVIAVFYPKKDMELLVRSKLKEQMPDNRELVDFNPSSVVYRLEQSDASLERARISVQTQAASRLTAQSSSLSADVIAGFTVADAKNKLSAVDGVESVDISLRPSWTGKLPTKDKIEMRIE